ncbi:Mixed lineage kinase domain-like protein [Myotis davidii]|uniref:Mixed lineage kinase domain-like protein n=1 Tax=Myotis davidii TaxID=225400 RepID=L5LG69_MYODS|nr:Mixed lineage kinase domain-like protein [Myotis davidii]
MVTGKILFAGCDSKIHPLVPMDQHQEPLGEDRPSPLQELIDDCQAYEPSRRPSAKEISEKPSIFYKAGD